MTQPLDALYRDIILDHYRSPRGVKELAHPSVCRRGSNPACGDELTLALDVENGVIKKVGVNAAGCAISIASSSMLTEAVEGKSLFEAQKLTDVVRGIMHGDMAPADVDLGDIDALKGVRHFPVRVKCALLSWVTLEDAIKRLQSGETDASDNSTTEKPGDTRPSVTEL